ncbi:hypothetical protein K2173_018684 [Erythroxylum novogranatense]|uniref:Gnk2-homologous domain-containing protein n=1 Tax=Erythroxylum novogranatense TaxID=1862640 RepID=A0AAV8SAZ6_9ROSI|nr:hypothetical protein K2173_018684 [Erythroxylum novogranatense]
MFSTKSASAFYLLSFAVLFQAVLGAKPIQHQCSIIKFMGDKNYESNVKQVTELLVDQTPSTGFSKQSVGNPFAKVYGLSLCRGDIKAKDCKACLVEASKEIESLCPKTRMAVIWSDNCMFKYSYLNFFGIVDYLNYYSNYNVYNKIKYEPGFTDSRNNFLDHLVDQVHKNLNMFAVGHTKVGKSKLYGMAQCTRDLSKSDCKHCLKSAVNKFKSSKNGKSTGWFGYGSCSIRCEAYPF